MKLKLCFLYVLFYYNSSSVCMNNNNNNNNKISESLLRLFFNKSNQIQTISIDNIKELLNKDYFNKNFEINISIPLKMENSKTCIGAQLFSLYEELKKRKIDFIDPKTAKEDFVNTSKALLDNQSKSFKEIKNFFDDICSDSYFQSFSEGFNICGIPIIVNIKNKTNGQLKGFFISTIERSPSDKLAFIFKHHIFEEKNINSVFELIFFKNFTSKFIDLINKNKNDTIINEEEKIKLNLIIFNSYYENQEQKNASFSNEEFYILLKNYTYPMDNQNKDCIDRIFDYYIKYFPMRPASTTKDLLILKDKYTNKVFLNQDNAQLEKTICNNFLEYKKFIQNAMFPVIHNNKNEIKFANLPVNFVSANNPYGKDKTKLSEIYRSVYSNFMTKKNITALAVYTQSHQIEIHDTIYKYLGVPFLKEFYENLYTKYKKEDIKNIVYCMQYIKDENNYPLCCTFEIQKILIKLIKEISTVEKYLKEKKEKELPNEYRDLAIFLKIYSNLEKLKKLGRIEKINELVSFNSPYLQF